METNLIAKSSVTINASKGKVWHALVTPDLIKQYMFGTEVASDWTVGGPITWKGEWQGKPYEDKGLILQFKPERTLQYTHFSPAAGLPDKPENYQTVSFMLSETDGETTVTVAESNFPSAKAREMSEQAWRQVLDALKHLIEA